MDPKGQILKSKARIFADNHSIILEIQQNWQQMEKSKAVILRDRDYSLCFKIRQQLQDFLCRLETVKEANPLLRDSKYTLVKDITKFKKSLDDRVLRRKSCVVESKKKWPDSISNAVLRRRSCVVVPGPDLEGHGFYRNFLQDEDTHMNANQATTDLIESEIHDDKYIKGDTKEPSATQNTKKNFIIRLSNVFERIVTCGSSLQG